MQERECELRKIFGSFKSAEIVITDRLHGLIFAAITETPCIVLQSNNHKIKATYETWLRSYAHIKMQKTFDVEETISAVAELQKESKERIRIHNMSAHYESLRQVLAGQ